MFNLLKEFRHALYLDVDVLIQKDISDILNYGPLSMGYHTRGATLRNQFERNYPLGERYPVLFSHLTGPAYNAGVIVASDELPYEKMTDILYDLTVANQEGFRLLDQSILNLLICLSMNHVENYPHFTFQKLPEVYNYLIGINENIKIIHSISHAKFWNCLTYTYAIPEWFENNLLWLSLGGSAYQGDYTGYIHFVEDGIQKAEIYKSSPKRSAYWEK
jgi:lipopolysaccharide biosynthesis glycosyltransferase